MTQQTATREVVITREFDAPRELVWKAWTDPEVLKQWWGPKDWSAPVMEMDTRVGGKFHFAMQGPDGELIYAGGEIIEVDPPKRLVITDEFQDKDGNTVSPSAYGMDGEWPSDCQIEVTLTEDDGKTTMTMRHGPLPTSMSEGANEGWNQQFDKLVELLRQS